MSHSKDDRRTVLHSSRAYYARRAEYYDLIAQRQPDERTLRELDFLKYAFKRHAKRSVKDVLDVACGGGRHAVGLAQRGFRCTGQDFTPERVEVAKARAERTGVRVSLKQGDATKLAYTSRFDAVLALYILFLLPGDDDVVKCLRKAYGVLRSGAVLVCNVLNPFTRGTNWMVELIRDDETVSETRARGVHETEIHKLKQFDPVLGVGWVQETGIIEAPDGVHVFRDRERFRLFTYWDIVRYLEDSGFQEIQCYPDWKIKPDKRPKAEQLVFVARK